MKATPDIPWARLKCHWGELGGTVCLEVLPADDSTRLDYTEFAAAASSVRVAERDGLLVLAETFRAEELLVAVESTEWVALQGWLIEFSAKLSKYGSIMWRVPSPYRAPHWRRSSAASASICAVAVMENEVHPAVGKPRKTAAACAAVESMGQDLMKRDGARACVDYAVGAVSLPEGVDGERLWGRHLQRHEFGVLRVDLAERREAWSLYCRGVPYLSIGKSAETTIDAKSALGDFSSLLTGNANGIVQCGITWAANAFPFATINGDARAGIRRWDRLANRPGQLNGRMAEVFGWQIVNADILTGLGNLPDWDVEPLSVDPRKVVLRSKHFDAWFASPLPDEDAVRAARSDFAKVLFEIR